MSAREIETTGTPANCTLTIYTIWKKKNSNSFAAACDVVVIYSNAAAVAANCIIH